MANSFKIRHVAHLYLGIGTHFRRRPPPLCADQNERGETCDKIDVSGNTISYHDGEIDVWKTLLDQKMHAEFISGIPLGPGAMWEPVIASAAST